MPDPAAGLLDGEAPGAADGDVVGAGVAGRGCPKVGGGVGVPWPGPPSTVLETSRDSQPSLAGWYVHFAV